MLRRPTAAAGPPGRRRLLVRLIQAIHVGMGATLAVVLGRPVLAPAFAGREKLWLNAVRLDALEEDVPVPVTLRVARADGASEIVDRRVVYLVRSGQTIRALDSTCTHLGCRTHFNAETGRIECPCHGGMYDTAGRVIGGPPPRALSALPARIEGDQVLVQI